MVSSVVYVYQPPSLAEYLDVTKMFSTCSQTWCSEVSSCSLSQQEMRYCSTCQHSWRHWLTLLLNWMRFEWFSSQSTCCVATCSHYLQVPESFVQSLERIVVLSFDCYPYMPTGSSRQASFSLLHLLTALAGSPSTLQAFTSFTGKRSR